jgi:hypothetical protein
MCLMAIGLVAGIAGSAVSAMGAMQQADAQAKSMEYNATVAKINARTERQKGAAEQEKIGIKYDRAEGTGIANAAKGGVDPTYGSAALTIFGTNWQDRQMDQGTAYVNAESADPQGRQDRGGGDVPLWHRGRGQGFQRRRRFVSHDQRLTETTCRRQKKNSPSYSRRKSGTTTGMCRIRCRSRSWFTGGGSTSLRIGSLRMRRMPRA